ncbi:MAG TPA: hypothetical protein DCG04_20255, partial [Rhodospirillaceae bacterium]|nr:hypothetical protein [Rhodospirillaceae bacterium]
MARDSDLDQKAAVSAKRTDPPRPYAPSEAARGTEKQPPDSVDQGQESGSAGLLNPLDSGRNDPNAGRAERDLLSPEALHRHFERASAANDTAAALNDAADDVAKTAGAAKSTRRPPQKADGDDPDSSDGGPQDSDSARNAAAERRANRNRRDGARDS